MALTDLPIPPRPASFTADGVPPGWATDHEALRGSDGQAWYRSRPKITPRTIVIHTNAASREGTVQSSINWGNSGASNTKPHGACNRPVPTQLVPTDRRAIANSTGSDIEQQYGVPDSSYWALAMETADMGSIAANAAGYAWPTDCGPFLYDHAEMVARWCAYKCIAHNIPPVWQTDYLGTGIVTHTLPFPYPYFTTVRGKTCPGSTKKRQVEHEIVPRAAQLVAAWTGTTPPPDEDDDMPLFVVKNADKPNVIGWHIGDRSTRRFVTSQDVVSSIIGRGGVEDWHTKEPITSVGQVTARPAAEWADGLGVPIEDILAGHTARLKAIEEKPTGGGGKVSGTFVGTVT